METALIDLTTAALWEHQGATYRWTRAQIETMVERANRGAQLLDEQNPGWNKSVLPAKLDMSNASFCIVGQTYGNYDEYVGPLFGKDAFADDEERERLAVEHGFLTQDEDEMPWALMDRVWVYLLTARADTGRPVLLGLSPREPVNLQIQRLLDEKLIARETLSTPA